MQKPATLLWRYGSVALRGAITHRSSQRLFNTVHTINSRSKRKFHPVNETSEQAENLVFLRVRPSLTLVRLFGAQCPLCDGIGCRECAEQGLR
jgi:hypothetical protein